MLKEKMKLAVEERERLIEIISLIESSIVKDAKKLAYEIYFECEDDGERVMLELSNESSIALLNDLIGSLIVIEENLEEIGFPTKVDMSSYKSKKLKKISKSNNDNITVGNRVEMLDLIESKLDKVEYLNHYVLNYRGKYTISKKSKFKILNPFNKKSLSFKNVLSLNADDNQYEIFDNSLRYLNSIIYKAVNRDMCKYATKANELQIII